MHGLAFPSLEPYQVHASYGHFPVLSIIMLRPNAILPRTQNPLRIQRTLNLLIKLHLRIVIEIIRLRNLIHDREMCPILSPTALRSIVYQGGDEPVCSPSTVRIFTIEDYADDMMHFSHTDDEGADEVEARLLAALPRDLILGHAIVSGDFCDGAEEEVGAIGEPVNPLQFCGAWDALESIVSRL